MLNLIVHDYRMSASGTWRTWLHVPMAQQRMQHHGRSDHPKPPSKHSTRLARFKTLNGSLKPCFFLSSRLLYVTVTRNSAVHARPLITFLHLTHRSVCGMQHITLRRSFFSRTRYRE